MSVKELINRLNEVDPTGDCEVDIYIHRRYGGYSRPVAIVRKFLSNGNVKITDETDENL